MRGSSAIKMAMLLVLFTLVLSTASVQCDVITIVTSATNPCPGELSGEVCLTLEQYVSNQATTPSSAVLMFQPGTHNLQTNFDISSGTQNFSMIAASGEATIACNSLSRTLTLSGVENVNIFGIRFQGCGSISVTGADTVQLTKFAMTGCRTLIILAVTVSFTHGVIANNLPTLNVDDYTVTIRYVNWRQTRAGPGSSVDLHNVTFVNNSNDFYIISMYNVTIDHLSFMSSSGLYASARDGTVTGSTHFGPQTELSMTNSVFSQNVHWRVIEIYMNKARISNVTFQNNPGGTLMSLQRSDFTFENTVFENNSFGQSFSVLRQIYAVGSNVTVLNCTFNSNTGTTVEISGLNLNVQGSTFTHNRNGASIVYYGYTINVSNSVFDSNSGSREGGAIYATPYLSGFFYNNTFTNNVAENGGAINFGWHYEVPSSNIGRKVVFHSIDNVFLRNRATGRGGAIHSNVTSASGEITVSNSVFRNNVATNDGGAVYSSMSSSSGDVRFDNCMFRDNNVLNDRGGAIFSAARSSVGLSIENTSFDSNSAPSCGAVVVTDHITVDLNSTSFASNAATANAIGGGVGCIRSASVSIENSTFTYNTANLHGGVMIVDNSSMSISDSTFLGNSAASNGGVFHTRASSSDYLISHSVFSQNSAHASGGVMYVNREGSRVTASQSIFSFNQAEGRGGVISLITGSLHISTSNIYNNTADIGSDISACSSDAVEVQGLNSFVDTSQPMCILYEGSVDTFTIELPHDLNTLVTSTPPTTGPVTRPHTTQPTNANTSSTKPATATSPTPINGTQPSSSNNPPPSYTCSPTDPSVQSVEDQSQEIKRLKVLVSSFAAIIAVLLLCVVVLLTKVIYDCVQSRFSKGSLSGNISLGPLGRKQADPTRAAVIGYTTLEEIKTVGEDVET